MVISIGCPPAPALPGTCGVGHSRFFMDLLEYQGKQLFRKHGVPTPEGRAATSVPEALEASDELGYPVVIKAQVLIGGRGQAGGLKPGGGRAVAGRHAPAI